MSKRQRSHVIIEFKARVACEAKKAQKINQKILDLGRLKTRRFQAARRGLWKRLGEDVRQERLEQGSRLPQVLLFETTFWLHFGFVIMVTPTKLCSTRFLKLEGMQRITKWRIK